MRMTMTKTLVTKLMRLLSQTTEIIVGDIFSVVGA
jgi:hypothetical protein